MENIVVLNKKSKLEGTLDSRNFWVSLITLALLGIGANGADIPDPEGVSGEIYDSILTGNVGSLLTVIFFNFVNPLIKIVRQKSWSWDFIKSMNFWTQFATVGLIALTALGISFPDGAAKNVIESVFGGEFQTIAIAFVINVINPLYHFFLKQKEEEILARPTDRIIPGKVRLKVFEKE